MTPTTLTQSESPESPESPEAEKASSRPVAAHVIPIILCFAVMVVLFAADTYVGAGALSGLVSSVALIVICITVLSKAGDMPRSVTCLKSQFRRISLVLVSACAVYLAVGPLVHGVPPTWMMTGFYCGVAAMCMTSNSIENWWEFVSGYPGWRIQK